MSESTPTAYVFSAADNAVPTRSSEIGAYAAVAKQRSHERTSRIPIKVVASPAPPKPSWLRVQSGASSTRFHEMNRVLRENGLHSVCEEASRPNVGECFGNGIATFMIVDDKCMRRYPFCDKDPGLKYIVITSIDRDDLRDVGAAHLVECIQKISKSSPQTRIETLTPDFRGRADRALNILKLAHPDVMNHKIEPVPRLYREDRPGSNCAFSLALLKRFKEEVPGVPTKSELMLGLGDTYDENLEVTRDLRDHGVDLLTIGQYLAPSSHHLSVRRYALPEAFKQLSNAAQERGFRNTASGPLVRASYHTDRQSEALL